MCLKRKIEISFLVALCIIFIPMIVLGFILQVISRMGLTLAYLLWMDSVSVKYTWYELQTDMKELWKEF